MSIDTSALESGVQTFMETVFTYVPLGLTILGVPAAIAVGMGFGGKIINMVKSAFGGK